MRRPTWQDLMTDDDWTEQAEHDRRHPGKVCQRCPSQGAHMRLLDSPLMVDYYEHQQWVSAGFVVALTLFVVALVLFFA